MKRLITFLSIILLLTSCNLTSSSESFESDLESSESFESVTSIEESESQSESIESESNEDSSEESESLESSEVTSESISEEESESLESSEITSESISEEESSEEDTIITISFYNWDDSLLYSYDAYKGEYPLYEGERPTKPSNDLYDYEFIGWDKEFEVLYEDTNYKAIFEEIEKSFTITDILENEEVYLNKQVILKNVGITSTYSPSTFVVASVHNPLDFYSIIVVSDDDISATFDKNDVIDVIGVVEKVNGRTIINHAQISWGYDGDEYSANEGALMGATKLNNREAWINEINYLHSSSTFYGDLVFASLPSIEPNKDLYFHVVFPAEDITINDNNFYLIAAFIPALSESQIEEVNSWISSFNIGSGLYGLFQPFYDNGEMKIIFPYDLIISRGYNTLIEFKDITSDYSIIDEFIKSCYKEDKVNFPSFDNESIYNYRYYKKLEKVNESAHRTVMTIEMYTYGTHDIISYLDEAFINSDVFTYLGIDNNNKHQVKMTYSSDSEMFISYYEGFGKVIFKSYLD